MWRRFRNSANHLVWDYDKQDWVPSPDAFQFDPEMSVKMSAEMSASWREHLVGHGLGPESILTEGYALVGEWSVASLRDEHRFPVEHSPIGEEPIGCAHVSIYWPIDLVKVGKTEPERNIRRRLRSTLAAELSWSYGVITAQRPDE